MGNTFDHPELSTYAVDPYAKYADWATEAERFRRAWMQRMGMSADEIDYHCKNDPPTDLDAEIAEYNAICRIQESRQ